MTTMAQKLQSVGYTTHAIGKWHAGFATPSKLARVALMTSLSPF